MKKSIKGVLLALVAVPCALILTACGGVQSEMVFKQTTFNAENPGFTANGTVTTQLTYADGKVTIPTFETGTGFVSKFGEYRNTMPESGYFTKLTVHIDPATINEGEGFTFSSAINDVAGVQLTEQMTHIRKISAAEASGTNSYGVDFDYSKFAGKVLIGSKGGRLNSQFTNPYDNVMEYSEAEITKAGWYTFTTTYTIENGKLKVEIKVADSSNKNIYTATPDYKNPSADAATYNAENVGGNRYGWFTFNTVTSGIQVKEISLYNIK